MERLTFEGNFCDIAQCAEIPGGSFCEDGACSQRKVWERLKAYEDTGLEPEKVPAVKLALMGKSVAEITEFEGVSIDRLKELAQADKEGRVLVLPVPMETTLYSIFAATHHLLKEGESPISEIEMGEHNAFSVCRHFGETIFLTREDAEQALERLRDDAVD